MPPASPDTPNPGTLYIVATPIGNPQDLSPRAREVLARVDLIAAEDTRVARTLLRRLDLRRPLLSYYDFNEQRRTPGLVERLRGGDDVALVADAGTPLVSDPGFQLVRAAVDAGVRVVPVPGPCAALAALVVSALPTDRFVVLGFLPRKPSARRLAIEELRHWPMTLVLYESPHRIVATLADLAKVLGDRRAALGRSLTKQSEAVEHGRLGELHDRLAGEERIYGEMTLVIEGAERRPRADGLESRAERAIDLLLAEDLPPRRVRDLVCELFEAPRKEVYRRVLARRDGDD